MGKRANGEGSIRKRKDGKWLVTFPTGLYKVDGKREYLYKYANTQAEAAEILRKLQAEKAMGISQSKATIKTGEYIENCIEKHKAPKLAPATLTSYRNNFRLHIKPYIGEIPIKKLETYHIQRCLDAIGGGYSTFIKNYNVIHGAMEMAVNEDGIILRNPCKGVAFPTDDTKEKRALSKEEQHRFMEALDGEYYGPMFKMYLYSGLRLGEGIALTWEDIDLERRAIRVNKKSIVCHDYNSHSAPQVVQDFCKTKSSKRTVVITKRLVDVLKAHRAEMIERAKNLGREWSETDLVFINTRGNMIHIRNLQESLKKIYRKAGIKDATMHTLRHTYATRCFEAEVRTEAISEQLGHSEVATTTRTYVHILEDIKLREIDKLDQIDNF